MQGQIGADAGEKIVGVHLDGLGEGPARARHRGGEGLVEGLDQALAVAAHGFHEGHEQLHAIRIGILGQPGAVDIVGCFQALHIVLQHALMKRIHVFNRNAGPAGTAGMHFGIAAGRRRRTRCNHAEPPRDRSESDE